MKSLIPLLLLWVACCSSYAHSIKEDAKAVSLADTPTINITIAQPTEGALVGNDLKVLVTVSSTFEIKSVKASVDGRAADLSFFSTAGWSGNISLSGLAQGEKTLTVIVTDALGNMAQAQRKFVYDQPPSLTVTAPLSQTVAHPTVFVDATCVDDDPAGCTSLTASINGNVVALGKDSIKGFLSLSAFDGNYVTLTFTVLDSKGQMTTLNRVIKVEASNNLSEVEAVGGSIIDVQPDRILFLDDKILKIHDRASGVDSVVMDDAGKVVQYGFLTPKGAIFVASSVDATTSRVYEWRDGSMINLGPVNSDASLKVKGKYAIWNLAPPLGDPALFLRDLAAGTNIEVTNIAGNIENDVSASGDVVYWSCCSPTNYNVYRYHNGVNTKLTNDSSLWNTYPRTDGINVIYRKHAPCCNDQTYAIVLYGSAGEIPLASPRQQEPLPETDYQLNGGWVAFTRLGTSALQVWTRSPAGEEAQITFYSAPSSIQALSPVGGVIFNNAGRSYLKEANAPALDVGSDLGHYFWQDGQWLVTIGRSLFRVNTTPPPLPTLLTEEGSQQAIALNAATWTRSPFSTSTTQNLSSDQHTRLLLLSTNVSLMPGDNTTAIFAQAEDARHRLYPLPVEYVGKVPNFDWLTQINVRLPDELQGVGNVWVSIAVRGEISNRVLVSIQ
jgi:Bacterial Ig domain